MAFTFAAVVYTPGALVHRGLIVSDNAAEFAAACANAEEGGKYRVADVSDLPQAKGLPQSTNDRHAWGVERLQALIAQVEGVDVDLLPSGRCAVVDPDTRDVFAFIVADPEVDAIDEAHPAGGPKACELHASDDAKLNDRITHEGRRLARVVKGDAEGKVEAVAWIAPTIDARGKVAFPEGYVEESHAERGETVEALKRTDTDMGVEAERF